jgi:hypothetical protein
MGMEYGVLVDVRMLWWVEAFAEGRLSRITRDKIQSSRCFSGGGRRVCLIGV